jgi:hypothetical protein
LYFLPSLLIILTLEILLPQKFDIGKVNDYEYSIDWKCDWFQK